MAYTKCVLSLSFCNERQLRSVVSHAFTHFGPIFIHADGSLCTLVKKTSRPLMVHCRRFSFKTKCVGN